MLVMKDLVKYYGSKLAVDGVSIKLNKGEIVGLLGPNGAGKTTTFYMTVGILKPNKGEIFIDDRNITKLPLYKRSLLGIGYLPQEPSVFRGLNVRDNIMAVLELRVKDKKERERLLEEVVEEMKLSDFLYTKAANLSGGERRRTEIARSLVLKPSFLLLDEPFTGIDPRVREELQEIIVNLKKKNIGVLITDHNVRETLQITDRSYLLYKGKIMFEGTSEELINNEEAKSVYLGERFVL